VGGEFTDAGGVANADRIAKWNGSSWSAVSSAPSQISNGGVFAIAVSGGKVYAGGTFTNAGGFACKLDKKKYKPCASPKTYKKLTRGRHVFRVKARDKAGNVDRTPFVKRFKIKRR
jgi:hypothetical protein